MNYWLCRPYLGQAEVDFRAQQFQEVIKTTEGLLRLDPTLGLAHYYKAVSHYSLGQLEEAEKSARTSLGSLHKPPPAAHFLLGSLLARKGTYPKAVEELRLFLKAEPNAPQAAHARNMLTQLEGRLAKAQKAGTAQQ